MLCFFRGPQFISTNSPQKVVWVVWNYEITQCSIFKIKSTVLCIYIDMDVLTQTTGKVKFSSFIPMHMTLIDSPLWVMMCSVSQCVAHSSRPRRSFDVCFVWNAYTLLYIQCDISCRMLETCEASMWRKTVKSIILNDLKAVDCFFTVSLSLL